MIEKTYHCDGPDCERNAGREAAGVVFLKVARDGVRLHFCGWDCLLRYGARIEPEEVIEA